MDSREPRVKGHVKHVSTDLMSIGRLHEGRNALKFLLG